MGEGDGVAVGEREGVLREEVLRGELLREILLREGRNH